eukprot:Skav232507  [mRNA]  locus=scaffold1096:238978:248699:+ [translate_table: standard]
MPTELRNRIDSLPKCLTCHGWSMVQPAVETYQTALTMLKEPASFRRLQGDAPLHLFLDGACASPDEPVLRYASWAVSCASSDLTSLSNDIVSVGVVPGLVQSAYRGELWALLSALELIQTYRGQVTLWSDNASVVKRFRRVMHGAFRVKPTSPHGDLWERIRQLVASSPSSKIQICKVVSHGDVSKAKNALEQWAFGQNHLVDQAARQSNETRPAAFWHLWTEAKEALQRNRTDEEAIHLVQLRTARRALSDPVKPQPSAPTAEPASVEASGDAEVDIPMEWHVPPSLASKVLARRGNRALITGRYTSTRKRWVERSGGAKGKQGPKGKVIGSGLSGPVRLATGKVQRCAVDRRQLLRLADGLKYAIKSFKCGCLKR